VPAENSEGVIDRHSFGMLKKHTSLGVNTEIMISSVVFSGSGVTDANFAPNGADTCTQ